MDPRSPTRIALAALVLATMLGGCTAMRRGQAPETTNYLTQAGFKIIQADTPERVAKLKTLTPYKVVEWKRNTGGVVYAYAEPDQCKCVYVGSPTQYAKFLQLQSVGEAEEMAAQERSESDEPEEFSDATIEAGG